MSDRQSEALQSPAQVLAAAAAPAAPEAHVTSRDARVTLKYHGLPHDSKDYLNSVLQSWCDWHKARYAEASSSAVLANAETGTVEFNPNAIAAGDMVVFVDKPATAHPDSTEGSLFLSSYETTNKVPKYDRTFESDPLRLDKSGERVAIPVTARAERRCHNCGSYAHLISSCPHECNLEGRIQEGRPKSAGGSGRLRSTTRYYAEADAFGAQSGAAGVDFSQLKPGQLADVTREALGLASTDPPPWLNRMRELGYPPMYRHSNSREAELTIFDDQTGGDAAAPTAAAQNSQLPVVEEGKELVSFPGLNAPIPDGADPIRWASTAPQAPPAPAAGSKRAQPEDDSSMLLPPPLKRIRTAEHQPRFLPTAAAHQHMSGYDSPLGPGSSNSIAASFQQQISAAQLAPSNLQPSAAFPFAAGPYINEAQRAQSMRPSTRSESPRFSMSAEYTPASSTPAAPQTSQAALQDQFVVASQFAASRAYGANPPPASLPAASLPPPGMYPYSYAHPSDAYSAYTNYANYAAHAARLASGAYRPQMPAASHHPHYFGLGAPSAYPYTQPAPPSNMSGAPPPPPSYHPTLSAPPYHYPQ